MGPVCAEMKLAVGLAGMPLDCPIYNVNSTIAPSKEHSHE
jgi:hypothetical protein